MWILLVLAMTALGADEILLWPNDAPGSEGKTGEPAVRLANGERVVSGIHKPALIPYLPAATQASGAAVIVIPGGGHRELWSDHEGHNVAQWLAARGWRPWLLCALRASKQRCCGRPFRL